MASSNWRFLDLKLSSYAKASLYMPTILTLREKEKIPNTLAVIRFARPAVCLFYYNDPEREIDLEFCRREGVEVARRDTGGAPYWMDPGTLLWVLCFDRREVSGFPENLAEGYRFLIEAVAHSFSQKYSLPAVYRPLNDLEVQGKKLAGHTLTTQGNICRWAAGPQILRPRMDLMSRALKPLPEKFADKEAKSIAARVTSLEDLMGYPPSFTEVIQVYIAGLQERLGIVFQTGELSETEKTFMAEREKKDFSEEWIMARSEKKKLGPILEGYRRGEHTIKVPQGPLIRAVVLTGEGKIQDLYLSGSIHCVPVGVVEEMEAALKGLPINEEAMAEKIRFFFQKPQVQIAGAKAEDFLEAIMGAIKKIKD